MISNTFTLKSRPEKPLLRKLFSLSSARFLYLCFHEVVAENIHQMLEANSISALSCAKITEWPGTVYRGDTPVFGLKIAVEESRIETLAEFLDTLLSEDLYRYYCDFSFWDEISPWFVATPHENDFYFQFADETHNKIQTILESREKKHE